MPHPARRAALLLALLASCGRAAAIVGSTLLSLRSGNAVLDPPFGFAAGGTVDVRVEVYGTDGARMNSTSVNGTQGVYFLGCEHDTLRAVRALADSGDVPDCLASVTYAAGRCDVPPVRVFDGRRLRASVTRTAVLTLAFLNCGEERASAIAVEFILLNPGGQNLPTAEAPLPPVYLTFALTWGVVAAAAITALGVWRRHASPLHGALMSVPLLKIAHMAVATAKWTMLSRLGVRNVLLDMTLVVVLTVSQVDYLGVLLLMSRGWHVTRTTLGAPERNSLLLSLSLLASLFFVYYLWSPRSFFALAVAYICVLGFALSSVSYGLRHLKAQAHLLRMSGSEAEDAAAWSRVQMFTGFHGALFVFTCVKIVLHLVKLFMPEEAWLNVLFAEVSDLGLALVVAVLFRPRAVASPFVEEATAGALHAAAGNVIAGRGRLSAQPTDDDLARAIAQLQAAASAHGGSGAAVDGAGRALSSLMTATTQLPVLVENPCSFDAAGRPVMSVSVGLPEHAPKAEEAGGDAAASGSGEDPQESSAPTRGHQLVQAGAVEEPPQQQQPQPPPHLQLAVTTSNPLWERRLTQTQPPEQDAAVTALDRFRMMWGAPPERPQSASDEEQSGSFR